MQLPPLPVGQIRLFFQPQLHFLQRSKTRAAIHLQITDTREFTQRFQRDLPGGIGGRSQRYSTGQRRTAGNNHGAGAAFLLQTCAVPSDALRFRAGFILQKLPLIQFFQRPRHRVLRGTGACKALPPACAAALAPPYIQMIAHGCASFAMGSKVISALPPFQRATVVF